MDTKWTTLPDTLTRTFEFTSFTDAVAFVNKIEKVANKQNHHPDILIHDYKYVTVKLTTHEAEKVTEKDHRMAKALTALYTS